MLNRTLDDPRLAPLDQLLRDLLNPDPRARLVVWTLVIAELRSVAQALRGEEEAQPAPAFRASISDRGKGSDVTGCARFARAPHQQQERDAWFRRLIEQLGDRARMVEVPLGRINAELGDVLTMAVTTGGPASSEQLVTAGVDDKRFFTAPLSGLVAGRHAVCLLIHSQQAIESFPTITIRIWPSFDGEQLWLLRAPMVSPHRALEAVATWLAPDLLTVFGPFAPFREATIDDANAVMEETARVFINLAEQYLEILDAGDGPAQADAWQGRKLVPAELIAHEDSAAGARDRRGRMHRCS